MPAASVTAGWSIPVVNEDCFGAEGEGEGRLLGKVGDAGSEVGWF